MKRLFILAILVCYVYSISGSTINIHFCGGKIYSITLNSTTVKPCCCNKIQYKCAVKNNCCNNKFIHLKNSLSINDYAENLTFTHLPKAYYRTKISDYSLLTSYSKHAFLQSHSPPIDRFQQKKFILLHILRV
jgi:hypothetical protein